MKVIAGISIYLTTDIKQADRWIKQLHRCANCVQFTPLDLFGGVCAGYGDEDWLCPPFEVDGSNCCECFYAKQKEVEYWLQKLGQICMEYEGTNDEVRILLASERKA